jgi:hypothetical protein
MKTKLRASATIAALLITMTALQSTLSPPVAAQANRPRPVRLEWNENEIPLLSGAIDVRTAGNDDLEAQQLPTGEAYYVVHLKDRPDRDTAARLVRAVSQENVVAYLPHNAYLCRLNPARMKALESIDQIDWIGPWKPEYKLSPDVYRETTAATTQETTGPDGEIARRPAPALNLEDEFVVTLFPGQDAAICAEQIEALGGAVRYHTADRLFVHLDRDELPQIAALNAVYWIERRYPMTTQNDNDTWIVQTDRSGDRKAFDSGVTGAGQIVAVADSGVDADHLLFWDAANGLPGHTYDAARRKILTYYNWYQTGSLVSNPGGDYYDPGGGYYPGAADPMYNVYDWDLNSGHGSHVAGTVAGEWPAGIALPTWGIPTTAGYDFYEGNAYGARLVFQDLGRADSPFIYPPPDLNDLNPATADYPGSVGLFPQALADGAYIHTNSWGGGGFGVYDSYSRDVDEMMWANPDFLIVFANGNDGPGTTTVTPPATAKNCLSVGAAETTNDGYEHDSENVADFSSWGPAGGWGRTKPDVCAPGYYIFSTGNDDQTDGSAPNDDLVGMAGTSMAAPGAAGAAALVRQYYTSGRYDPPGSATGFVGAGAFTPSAALLKATLINSAQPMHGRNTGGAIPGDGQGWGRILLDNALHFAGDTRSLLVDDDRAGLDGAAIVQPFFRIYTVRVGPGQPLDVTLVYNDPPGAVGSAYQMVNYLYVEVDHPNGSTYWLSGRGNFNNGQSVPNTAFIYPDVVQKVRLNDPDPGLYTIYAVAFQTDQVTPGWNAQPYALTVSGNLVQSQGYLQFDQEYYTTTGPLNLTLTDADLAGTGVANVTLTSASTGDVETATLAETGGASGIFRGAFPAAPGAANPGDGALQVADPDTLTATFNDASPVGVRTDTAYIDGIPPLISNVTANACNGSSVEIAWNTDEDATSALDWGMTTAYGNTLSDGATTTDHRLEFDGLQMGDTYYYRVCSTDRAGNTACSGPHDFTTPAIHTPPRYRAGYVAQYDYGAVFDDDDLWTGHNSAYAGVRHGVFQFDLSDLPADAYLTDAQIVLFKQTDALDPGQADTWSANLINFSGEINAATTFADVHDAAILTALSPTWTTAQLVADAPGVAYTLAPAGPGDVASFNPGGVRPDRLTFRMDGATTGDSIVSWDTGYRQDLGSLSVCYKPQLTFTYTLLPVADAGPDQSVGAGALVTLDGRDSSDPDGDLPLGYNWTQIGGPPVTLSDSAVVSPTFTAPNTTAVLTFTLAVTDALGATDPTPDEIVVVVSKVYLYLPLVFKSHVTAPDLVVDSLVAAVNSARVVVKNVGNAPVTDEFWVDVYVNPDAIPTAVNQTWDTLGDQGLVWGVTADALPLAPGQALTLTVGGDYYVVEYSHLSWPLPVGASVYAQADSADAATIYGAVLESHEITGQVYNNISSTVSTAGFGDEDTPPAGNGSRPTSPVNLPPRR